MGCKYKSIDKINYCSGDLRNSISITQRAINSFSTDPFNPDYIFTEIKKTFAGIKTTSGNVIIDGVAVNDGATHVFVIRYRENITQELYIEFKNYRYEIIDITNVNEQDTWLELRCKRMGLIELKASDV